MFQHKPELYYTDDQFTRLERIWGVITTYRKNVTMSTKVELKAAAIWNHIAINPFIRAKITKHINHIINNIIHSDLDLTKPEKLSEIVELLRSTEIEPNDVILLNNNEVIIPNQYIFAPKLHTTYEVEQINDDFSTIHKFELMLFGGFAKHPYTTDMSFSTYLLKNILYKLNASSITQLKFNNDVLAKIAILVALEFGYDDIATKLAFKFQIVKYKDVEYNTSFIPKFYDVDKIRPSSVIGGVIDNDDLKFTHKLIIDQRNGLQYYNDMDPKTLPFVPKANLRIFKIFPFKAGHYINPETGNVMFLNKKPLNPNHLLNRLISYVPCNEKIIQQWAADFAEIFTLPELISFTVNSSDIKTQAFGLLALRIKYGIYIKIDTPNLIITLRNAHDILSWLHLQCYDTASNVTHGDDMVLLPHSQKSPTFSKPYYEELIRDIAASAITKLNATLICSSYTIPELYLYDVHKNLNSDAEKYVFLTLLCQKYPRLLYMSVRDDKLNPIFGSENINVLEKYEPNLQTSKIYNENTIQKDLENYKTDILRPFDLGTVTCPIYKCLDQYEFTNPKLNELVMTGDTTLNEEELISFITLMVSIVYKE